MQVSCAAPASAGLHSFLSKYNVSNSTISGASYYNQSIGSSRYLLMQPDPTSFNRFVIINISNGYSFVTDNYTAFNIIKPFLTGRFYPNSTVLSGLNSSMRGFALKAGPPLTQCLFQTGLTYHMCTASTGLIPCLQSSCQAVPICGGVQLSPRSALYQFGIPSPFASGILNFSINYLALNSSYGSYYSLLSTLNQGNYATNMNGMQAALANITSLSSMITKDPIFPVPANISIATQTSVCASYIPPSGPWWCYAIGYCGDTAFNYTTLSSISSQLTSMQSLPVSYSAMSAITANSTALASGYLNTIVNAQKTVLFNKFISAIMPAYNSMVANATVLANEINEPSLSSALQNLKSTYGSVSSSGINQNLTAANTILSSAMSNLSAVYRRFNSLYGGVFGMAANNTHEILVKEFSFKSIPASLAALAGREQLVNVRLNGGVNASVANALVPELKSIKSGIGYVMGPISLASMVKTFDGGFVSSLLSGSNAPMAAKLSGGSIYAAGLSLIVAIIIFALFYLLIYRRLGRKHKIKSSSRVKRAWRSLFIAMLVMAVLYAALTYIYAGSASNFLPLGGFMSALKGSTSVSIAYNSSSNSSVVACASALSSTLQSLGKRVQTITLRNYSCIASSNSTLAGTECMNKIFASMRPVVLIDQGSNASIAYKGLYGTVLHASGSLASGPSCTLNTVLKYK